MSFTHTLTFTPSATSAGLASTPEQPIVSVTIVFNNSVTTELEARTLMQQPNSWLAAVTDPTIVTPVAS